MNNLKLFKINYLLKTYLFSVWQLFKKSDVSSYNIYFIFILSFLGSLLEAIFILLLAPLTSAVFSLNKSQNNNIDFLSQAYNYPFFLLLIIVLTLFAKSSIITYSSFYVMRVITLIRKRLRLKIVETIFEGSWKTNLKSGKLLDAYLVSSTNASLTVAYFNELLTYSLYVVAIVITLFLNLSIDLIIILAFLGVFYYLTIYFLSKKARDLSFINLDTNQKLSQLASEVIRGSREIQIYRLEKLILGQLSKKENILVKNESILAFLNKFPSVLPSTVITLVVIYGYFAKGSYDISSSSPIIVTSLVAVQRLSNYLSIVGQKLTMIGTGTAEIGFILKKLNSTPTKKGKKIQISRELKNSITFNKLNFNYGNDKELLKNLNLKFSSGKVSIIAGPSGSGKSSLFSLILKEVDPLEGKIEINGKPLNAISKKSWYENLSFVSQSPFIFGTSILNNIKIGSKDASYGQIYNAAKQSGALDFIDKLSNKFDFNVFDGGTNLSGGQCQLISLTRAILQDTPVVLLDEPSNNLDLKSIEKIKELFLSWANKNKIVLVITHDSRLIDKRFDIYNVENFNLIKKENF